jgi:hypothetical protein
LTRVDRGPVCFVDELCPLPGCPETLAVAKVDFKKGKAKVTLDLSLFPAALNGSAFRLRGGSLLLPPTNRGHRSARYHGPGRLRAQSRTGRTNGT